MELSDSVDDTQMGNYPMTSLDTERCVSRPTQRRQLSPMDCLDRHRLRTGSAVQWVSVRSCRANRARPDPKAARMASSRCQSKERPSSKFQHPHRRHIGKEDESRRHDADDGTRSVVQGEMKI